MKNILLIPFFALFASVFLIPTVVSSAEGDVLWTKTSNPSTGDDWPNSGAMDSTGLYIVGADLSPVTNYQWRIEKYSLDGNLLWTRTSNPSTGYDAVGKIVIDSTGIYVSGSDYSPGNQQGWIQKRSLIDGSLIWVRNINPSTYNNEGAGILAIDSTGLYLAVGDWSPGNSQWHIKKLRLDTGEVLWTRINNPSNINSSSEGISTAQIDSTGIYVVGNDVSMSPAAGQTRVQVRVEKLRLDTGEVLWTSTSHLTPILTIGMYSPHIYSSTIDNTGLYIAGVVGTSDMQWLIKKLRLDTGEVLWTRINDPSTGNDFPYSVIIDSTGLYVVGGDSSQGASNQQWRIEKYSLDGNLLWTRTSNPSINYDAAFKLAIDSTGIYVTGSDGSLGTNNSQWRIEKYSLDGNLLWTRTSNPSTNNDLASFLNIDNTGLYAVGYDYSPGNQQWRIEKREIISSYTVSATAGAGGTISPASRIVSSGNTTTFTVTPNAGYTASASGCGGSLSGTTYTTGTITSACTVSATFTLNSYTVSTTAGAGGTISPVSRMVSYGGTTTFTVTPNAGYTASASGCGGSLSGTTYTTGAITGVCTVSATFTVNNTSSPPTISGPTTRITGQNGTYSFVATDPEGDSVRYGIDWDMDNLVDNWLPVSGYVSSGTSRSMSYSWPSTGNKQFKALTQDILNNNSTWATYSVAVSDPQICTETAVDSVGSWSLCASSATCSTPPSPAQLTNQSGIQSGTCPPPEYTNNTVYRTCNTATITCTPSTFCGDNICNGLETMTTCPVDCKPKTRFWQF